MLTLLATILFFLASIGISHLIGSALAFADQIGADEGAE